MIKHFNLQILLLAVVVAVTVVLSPAAYADTTPYKAPASVEKEDEEKKTEDFVEDEVVEEVPESYIQDAMFTFSPDEFIERFLHFLAPTYPDALLIAGERGLELFLSGDENDDVDGLMFFFHKDTSTILTDEYSTEGVWCVSLAQIGDPEFLGALLPKEVLQAFYHAGDPQLTDSDFTWLYMIKVTAAFNATLGDPVWPTDYEEHHGVFYEFDHQVLDPSALGVEEDPIAVEQVQIYAANWMKDAS